jgi:N-ethylmaleimide reductase
MAEYYAQRAAAGLIITEATAISQQGTGCPNPPGIYTDEQVDGWQRVTEAVHHAGGRIFLQLWHMGRISHPSFQPGGVFNDMHDSDPLATFSHVLHELSRF